MVVCTFRQANINHKHRMRWLGPGMLVRHSSFPDKELRRGKPPVTQRDYRHSRLSQSGRVTPTSSPSWEQHTGGAGDGPRAVRCGNRERCWQHEVNDKQTCLSYRQFKIWELCCNTISQKTRGDINRFSDNFWNNLFWLLIKKSYQHVSCTLQ